MIFLMDVFLVKLSLTIGHIATAMLPLVMNNLPQKSIHSGLTFVIKHPLKRFIFAAKLQPIKIRTLNIC